MIEYNPKIDYLFCKYLIDKKFDINDEKEWIEVYKETLTPNNAAQVMMLKAKRIMKYIKRKDVIFTPDSILHCLSALTNDKTISEKTKKETIKLVDELKVLNIDDISSYALIYVLQNNIFEQYNVEMAKIIHYFLSIKLKNIPAIIYYFHIEKIKELISRNEVEGALLELKQCYIRTMHFNNRHALMAKKEIINIILQNKSYLQDKYQVKELYIYGSYAKETFNEYSDLDVFIKIPFYMENPYKIKYEILEYLSKQIGIETEGIIEDVTYSNDSLKEDIKRNLEKIF